jgi:RecB family exonuclease
MDHILTSLDAISCEHGLGAKHLVTPSSRVGRQWLEGLARRGGGVVNWQVETPVSLAMRIVGSERTSKSGRLLPALLTSRLAQEVLGKLRAADVVSQSPEGYGPALWRTLTQLREAGISAGAIDDRFWAQALVAYQTVMDEVGFFDTTDLWTWATDALAASGGVVEGGLIVLPQSVLSSATPVVQRFWEAMDESSVVILPDIPEPADSVGRYDPQRLAEVMACGEVSFHQAVGTTMEVRRVFRECLSRGIALDQVELLYTRDDVYLPIIHEECLRTLDTPDVMTSVDGIPIIFTRPARLIKRLCVWAYAGYDQRGFESILLDGLLTLPEGMTRFETAGAIRRLRIGSGKERWRAHLADERAAITVRRADPEQMDRDPWWERQGEVVDAIITVIEPLFEWLAPLDNEGVPARELFDAIVAIITDCANAPSQADGLGRQRLVDTFSQLAGWHKEHPKSRDREGMLDEIDEILGSLAVGASGPQPGKLFVAPVSGGGHSGREHTFIVGMNDHAFPGSVRQDPLLGDPYRKVFNERLGCALPLSGENVHEAIDSFVAMLGRVEGELQISFASHDMVADRSLYPATMLLPMCAVHRGVPVAGLSDLQSETGLPISYLPRSSGEATSETFATLASHGPEQLAEGWTETHEHLVRGQRASHATSDADTFTPWDGKLSEGDASHKTFSPSRLELLAGCPRRYFFGRVLALEPPETFETDADQWLDARAYGTLMHDVFCRYYRQIIDEDRWADSLDERRALLDGTLARVIAETETVYPPPNANARQGLWRRAQQACAILIGDDDEYMAAAQCRPRALEVSVGLPPGDDVTEFDRLEPVELTPGLFIRGKIDRIDESVQTPGELRLWDYKTGSTWAFQQNRPFDHGRKLQHYMYDRMVRAAWPGAAVCSTGYFFPSATGRGERISYDPKVLVEGEAIVRQLATMIRTGSYPATNDVDDCRFCDFATICGDVEIVTARAGDMIAQSTDERLAPMRALREVEASDE